MQKALECSSCDFNVFFDVYEGIKSLLKEKTWKKKGLSRLYIY